ncbi:MAG: hypothetical protein QXR53_01270 [Candidatus Norongarragalinales archaeon]
MGKVGLENSKLIAAFALALLAIPFSHAVENCADLIRFGYSSSAIMPIYGQDVSPGGAVVAVVSLKPVAFYLGENGYAEYFFTALEDQYQGGKQLMAIGDVFYRHENTTGFNNTYFRKAKQKPVYVESGDEFTIEFQPDFKLEYKDRSFTTGVLRFSSTKPIAFGAGYGFGDSVIALAETLDPLVAEFKRGSIFLESKDGLVYVPDGRVRFVGSCTASCSDPDVTDYYSNATCKSTLVDGSDYCLSESELVEFSCSFQNNCAPKQFSCPFGCKDGKCITGEKAKCEDSDGLNLAQRGRTSGNYPNGSKFSFLDECSGSTKLIEYYCTEEKVLKKNVLECNGGSCEDGACVPVPTVAECSDTDGGRDYETSGVCSDSSGSYPDSCAESSVVEYYCESGYCKTIVSPCSQCSENACSKSELVPTSNTALFAIVVLAVAVLAFALSMRGRRKETLASEIEKISYEVPKPPAFKKSGKKK